MNPAKTAEPIEMRCGSRLVLAQLPNESRKLITWANTLAPLAASAFRQPSPTCRIGLPRFRLNTYGRRAFSVAGPMAWKLNSLPDFIRDPTSSTDCYRRLLQTYLFARY